MLLPRLEKFNADLIFISAGFDAHYDDFYHFLTEQDLHWVTEQLCAVADKSGAAGQRCGVISVLEGGYSLSSPLPKAKSTRTGAAVPAACVTGSAPAAAAVAEASVEAHASTMSAVGVCAASAAVAGAPVTSPGGAELAGSALGRGGRLKAKKEKAAGSSAVPASTTAAATASSVLAAAEHTTGVVSPECKATAAVPAALPVPPLPSALAPATHGADCGFSAMDTMYAQRPGDGGLVKG